MPRIEEYTATESITLENLTGRNLYIFNFLKTAKKVVLLFAFYVYLKYTYISCNTYEKMFGTRFLFLFL